MNPDAGDSRKATQHSTISPYVTGAGWFLTADLTVLPAAVPQLSIMCQIMT
ncbi:hypothetical protein GCM10009646_48610 [Streptomyces aureus]